jgi:hypothetical protein
VSEVFRWVSLSFHFNVYLTTLPQLRLYCVADWMAEKMRNEIVVALLKLLLRHLPGVAKENYKKSDPPKI